jgi:preprotein translocase subunit SecA
MREVEKVILLRNVDKKWMEHLENMDDLKEYVGLNSYAQRDPVAMYRLEGADMFDKMVDEIKEDTVREILTVVPRVQSTERVQVAKPTSEGFGGGKPSIVRKPATSKKVGRNDPCPCGSGKKYKKCCGANQASDS